MLINLGAELTAQLLESRADAESLMLDTCTIIHPTGTDTDPDTGVVVVTGPTVYTGKAKVATYEAQESNPEAGESVRTVQRYALHIPVGSYAPEIGDVATVTAAALDPNLTGRRYRIAALLHKTLATAYRLGVTED